MNYKETRTYYFDAQRLAQAQSILSHSATELHLFDDRIVINRYWDDYRCYCDACKEIHIRGYHRLTVEHGEI